MREKAIRLDMTLRDAIVLQHELSKLQTPPNLVPSSIDIILEDLSDELSFWTNLLEERALQEVAEEEEEDKVFNVKFLLQSVVKNEPNSEELLARYLQAAADEGFLGQDSH